MWMWAPIFRMTFVFAFVGYMVFDSFDSHKKHKEWMAKSSLLYSHSAFDPIDIQKITVHCDLEPSTGFDLSDGKYRIVATVYNQYSKSSSDVDILGGFGSYNRAKKSLDSLIARNKCLRSSRDALE
jgi:hypothetical protein